ncbi:MAG: ATP synthase F1 subunit gamma [Bdellovibrionales bacterium]|nr:ATP synthase F1 subunit gamma [Bdellovibrionales bacterium]
MPSIKDLKKRIGTVKNTQQTTRAMKMVSAAKLRRAQEAVLSTRPYARQMQSMIQALLASFKDDQAGFDSDLFGKLDDTMAIDGESLTVAKSVLVVVVTSDRGLCGGFNGNVIKAAQKWLLTRGSQYRHVTFSFVGRRGYDFFKTKGIDIDQWFTDYGGKVTFQKAKGLADDLVKDFRAGKYDEIKIIYNEFKNAASQITQVEDFLPLKRKLVMDHAGHASQEVADFLVKPDPATLFQDLVAKSVPMQTFRILLESQAGEHGARMSAMENATKNAGEMIKKLTLQYNKQRQAAITKELLEIISGSEAQKG